MPHAHFSLFPDPLQDDLQIQHVLKMSTLAGDPSLSLYSAKRSRSTSLEEEEDEYSNNECSSDVFSDESGRFDDADESASTHSVKRRRSNDWPFNGTGSGPNSPLRRRRKQGLASNSNNNNNNTTNYNNNNNNNVSARISTDTTRTDEHPRRSRFIEERMCDSVSEKPPSIFTGSHTQPEAKKRNSGIFRFGKAIASVFNPFGNSWRLSTSSIDETEERARDVTMAQVEKAYEELKRSGYKGTTKGSYNHYTDNKVDSANADQTWKTIQEKMAYPEPASTKRHSRHDSSASSQFSATPSLRDSLTMFGTSLQDLRRAKPSQAASSAGQNDTQTEWSEVKKKKSRKELQKQAKLIKRVSNLEEKLERARRELREVTGVEEEIVPKSPYMDDRPYPRKFVPGALPTLPSERLLDRQAVSASPEHGPVPFTTLSPNIARNREEALDKLASKNQRLTPEPPASAKKHSRESVTATDSPQRKRKSPSPAPKPEQPPTADANRRYSWSIIPTRTPSTSRKPKQLKTNKGESPTSAEVKQSSSSQNQHKPARHRRHSPPAPSSKRTSISPRLRMKKAQPDLRSVTETEFPTNTATEPSVAKNTKEAVDDEGAGKPSPSPGAVTKERRRLSNEDYHDDDYVPPVPPIPKNIVAAAVTATATATTKFDARSFKKRERRKRETTSVGSSPGRGERGEEFKWPEEFF